jgi:hypothetical protein
MAKRVFTKTDVESLAQRLLTKVPSPLLTQFPELQRDVLSAAYLLRYMAELGLPVQPVEVDYGQGKVLPVRYNFNVPFIR